MKEEDDIVTSRAENKKQIKWITICLNSVWKTYGTCLINLSFDSYVDHTPGQLRGQQKFLAQILGLGQMFLGVGH